MDIQNIQNTIQPKERGTFSSVNDRSSAEGLGVSKNKVSEEVLSKTETGASTDAVANIDKVLKDVNDQLQTLNSYLKFEKDESSQRVVFFIKNTETDETLRQFPSEEFLAISKNITEYLETVQNADAPGKNPSPVGLITSQVV